MFLLLKVFNIFIHTLFDFPNYYKICLKIQKCESKKKEKKLFVLVFETFIRSFRRLSRLMLLFLVFCSKKSNSFQISFNFISQCAQKLLRYDAQNTLKLFNIIFFIWVLEFSSENIILWGFLARIFLLLSSKTTTLGEKWLLMVGEWFQ